MTALHKFLPNNIETEVVYTERNWVPVSKIKRTKFHYKHDLVFYVKCLEC